MQPQFSLKWRKNQNQVQTPANHNSGKHCNEPISTQSHSTQPVPSAGKYLIGFGSHW